ncbi:CHRD domain-containing protein [Pseudolysobacter antarcticus]|uniref:CHRD domain-containing protein n=1 Tax=Pseudolysobacter antarcticus TaxID=2511995 RepID=A0A411HM54_9GAMM|nr:CHRD domain-containing protein [Pseudolysobacter antarcticus]QBB71612.1 CHRD domain-containing protein [Pseudolysobacter antarcticus]
MSIIRRVLLIGAALFLACAGHAATQTYKGVLSGAAEVPANTSTGAGSVVVTYATSHVLTITASFSGLTGPSTAAHIHCCADTASNAPVATQTPSFSGFPLGVTSGTYTNSFDLAQSASFNAAFVTAHGGTIGSAEAALLAGFATGTAYFDIHTTVFPGGEIRAQLPRDIFLDGFEGP